MCDSDGECSISLRELSSCLGRSSRGRIAGACIVARRRRAPSLLVFPRRHAPPVVRRRRPVAAAAATAASSRRSGPSSRDSAASISSTSSSPRRRATRSPSTATRSTTWVDALRSAPEIERVDAGVVDRTRDFGWLADRQLLLLHGRLARRGAAPPDARRDARRGRRQARAADGAVAGGGGARAPGSARSVRPAARRARRRAGRAQRRHRAATATSRRIGTAGWSSRGRGVRRTTPTFSRALDARLRAIEQRSAARAAPATTETPRRGAAAAAARASSPAGIASRSKPKRWSSARAS